MDSSVPIKTPALFAFFPEAAYDSYVTIGLTEEAAAGEGNINTIESAINPWGSNFENGQDLLIDDAIGGGWFIFNGNTNGVAGDDEQYSAQVTTNGMLSGSLYVQVFVNGNPNTDNRILLDLEDACLAPGGPEVCEFPQMLATTATATASMMPTATVCVTSLKSLDVPMQRPVTTMRMQQTTTTAELDDACVVVTS